MSGRGAHGRQYIERPRPQQRSTDSGAFRESQQRTSVVHKRCLPAHRRHRCLDPCPHPRPLYATQGGVCVRSACLDDEDRHAARRDLGGGGELSCEASTNVVRRRRRCGALLDESQGWGWGQAGVRAGAGPKGWREGCAWWAYASLICSGLSVSRSPTCIETILACSSTTMREISWASACSGGRSYTPTSWLGLG